MADAGYGLARLPKGLKTLGPALAKWGEGAGLKGSVYLLIDCSTSMSSGNKLQQAKLGALRFATEAWGRHYAVGIISFSTGASCLLSARGSYPQLYKPLESLEADGRTAMAEAISLARRKLAKGKGTRVICLITDGKPDCREATLQAAAVARACGIEVIAIGTDGADEAFLASLATRRALAVKVPREELEQGVSAMAKMLPERLDDAAG